VSEGGWEGGRERERFAICRSGFTFSKEELRTWTRYMHAVKRRYKTHAAKERGTEKMRRGGEE
jgi:hypothetical protein